MWALRFLNGPQAGQIYMLKEGANKIGRSPNCDLVVKSSGISKEHLEIVVTNGRISLSDLNSSNGTYVNGTRIQKSILRLGDKLGVDQVLFDVIKAPTSAVATPSLGLSHSPISQAGPVMTYQQPAMPGSGVNGVPAASPDLSSSATLNFQEKVENYINHVMMPGLYQLVEIFEFRVVMMGFALIFIFSVTLLSVIPMNQITSESIRTESRRRAITVSRALANSNERAIRSGEMTGYSADLVLKDEGISNVYILAKDGSIMAPPEMAGLTAKDLSGFVSQIKGQTREFAAEIGSGKIAASCPILVFDPELQQNVAKAYAVVVYDTGSLKFDDGRALGLFIQMLAISMIVGIALFFLMYKLIEYPFRRLHQELDVALREGLDHAKIPIKFPLLQDVLVAVNSLLTRIQSGTGAGISNQAHLSDSEWVNMIQLFGYPAILLSKEMQIVTCNSAFEALTGAQAHVVQGQALAYLPDQALQKNISELAKAAHGNTHQMHHDRLEISGDLFSIQCQAMTVSGEARYYLISISPLQQAEGGAA